MCSLTAQQLPLVHYGVRDGLPSSYVSALAKDEDGLIWMVSSAGLVRYDGVEFRTWRETDGLLTNSPDDIIIDRNGSVWMIYVHRGIQYMDRKGTLYTVPESDLFGSDRIAFLTRVDDGTIIALGQRGYYSVSKKGISGPNHPLGREGPVDAVVDIPGRGRVFATTEGAVLDSSGHIRVIPLPYDDMGGREIDALVTRGGTVWCYGHYGWVAIWDGSDARSFLLPVPSGHEPPIVSKMAVDRAGRVWIGSFQGLFRLHDDRVESFNETDGLLSSWISDVLIDGGGVLWLATEAGVNKLSQPAFRNYSARSSLPVNAVWAIEELSDGTVWLGTNNGIVVIDTTGGPSVMTTRDGLPEESIVDIKSLGDIVWILGFNGVYRWSRGGFTEFPYEPFGRIILRSILPVSPSDVWIATAGGLFRLDPYSGKYSRHPFHADVPVQEINRIIPRSKGGWWILGSRLWVWREGLPANEIPLPDWLDGARVISIKDQQGNVFLITSKGLAILEDTEWVPLSTEGQIPFDGVRDGTGTYWIGCGSGIINHDGETMRVYGYYDGAAVEECNTNATHLGGDGRIWLAGKNVTVVDPTRLASPPVTMPLVIEAAAEDAIVHFPSTLSCHSRDQSVRFRLACPSFFNEQEMKYRYKLRGLETGWNDLERGAWARYTKLPPGDYVLEFQARQKNGKWNGPVATLAVGVIPAWWQTTIARISFIVGLIALGFGVALVRVRYLEEQRRKLQCQVAEQTMEIRRQRDNLAELARVDELTGLPNRRTINERIELELVRAKRYGRPMSLMIFDIDHFKTINDSHGHATGDDALRAISSRGEPVIRDTDVLSRWGGDEFIFLMPETDKQAAMTICKRLKSAIENPVSGDHAPRYTISGGISTFGNDDHSVTPSEFLEAADAALYRAKERGRNIIIHQEDE